MPFETTWPTVRDSIVALAPMFYTGQRDFPEILGTGFVVSRDGVVCTCKHVADLFATLPRPAGFDGIPAVAVFFREDAGGGWGFLPRRILAVGGVAVIGDAAGYRGPIPPDVSYLVIDVRETPWLPLAEAPLLEGEQVAVAGFPMGTDLLRAPGWLHQLTPTLHAGIVSAVLPYGRHPRPHGCLLDVQILGGSSGSPVFRQDGTVVGMVYAQVNQPMTVDTVAGAITLAIPAGLACCVSRDVLVTTLPQARAAAVAQFLNRPTFAEVLDRAQRQPLDAEDGLLAGWPGRPVGE
jgi:hypothetical protein